MTAAANGGNYWGTGQREGRTPKPQSQTLAFPPSGWKTRIDVRLEDETAWLTQGQLVDLFQSSKQNISLHIRNLFGETSVSGDWGYRPLPPEGLPPQHAVGPCVKTR